MKHAFGILCIVGAISGCASQRLAEQSAVRLPLAEATPLPIPSLSLAEQPTVRLPLAEATSLPIQKVSLAELAERWPTFKHAPFETAGYNHFPLPIRYVGPKDAGSEYEAYALAFLLSNSLDWGRGCYCARHAYFIFKRERAATRALQAKYDPVLISTMLHQWNATHAIGGELTKTPDGYSGVLEIFDRNGLLAKSIDYEKPRHFFDLLGDMSVDALTFLDVKPTAALSELLHERRCHDPQSIVDLGQAIDLESLSEEVFEVFRRILRRDPGFADVRFWYANQTRWRYGDIGEYSQQVAKALNSYPIAALIPMLGETNLGSERKRWIDQAKELVGPDAPLVIRAELEYALQTRQPRPELVSRGLAASAKYPNSLWLMLSTALAGTSSGGWPVDFDVAISLQTAGLKNRFLPGIGHKHSMIYTLTADLLQSGHPALAVGLIVPAANDELAAPRSSMATDMASRAAWALVTAGQYDMALRYYDYTIAGYAANPHKRARAVVDGAVAAAHAGRKDVLDSMSAEHAAMARDIGMLDLIEAYRGLMDGDVSHPFFQKKWFNHRTWWGYRLQAMLLHEADLIAGEHKLRFRINHGMAYRLNDREWWILFDAYERAKPLGKCASFYIGLEWLHGDDPWVVEAVDAFRRRTPDAVPLSPEAVAERLIDFAPELRPMADPATKKLAGTVLKRMPPFSVAAAVRTLLDRGEFDAAEKLTLRFKHLAADYNHYKVSGHAQHLWHRVQQARQKAALPQVRPAEHRPADDQGAADPEAGAGDEAEDGRADQR